MFPLQIQHPLDPMDGGRLNYSPWKQLHIRLRCGPSIWTLGHGPGYKARWVFLCSRLIDFNQAYSKSTHWFYIFSSLPSRCHPLNTLPNPLPKVPFRFRLDHHRELFDLLVRLAPNQGLLSLQPIHVRLLLENQALRLDPHPLVPYLFKLHRLDLLSTTRIPIRKLHQDWLSPSRKAK